MTIKHIEKTHTLQLDQSDCGVACLMSIIKLNKGTNSIENLRELSGTTIQGTTMLGLYQVANKIGFTAEGCEADLKALIEHKQPVILHVVIENQLQHYIVCYLYDEQKGFLIGNPANGVHYLSANELEKIWVSKTCLTLEPNENFIKIESQKNVKRDWFLNLLKEDYKVSARRTPYFLD
jgi:ATP-binding cassette subfamily B protein